jgi:hypothetical protein
VIVVNPVWLADQENGTGATLLVNQVVNLLLCKVMPPVSRARLAGISVPSSAPFAGLAAVAVLVRRLIAIASRTTNMELVKSLHLAALVTSLCHILMLPRLLMHGAW